MRRPGWAVLALPLLVAPPVSEALAAIAFVKNVGTNGTTTTGTTLAVTVPAGGVAVNDTVVISFAMDPTSGTVSAADARGNTYTADANFQQGTSGSGTGVRQVLLSARLGTALVAGDSITVTHPSVAARAMSVSEFSGLAATAMLDRTSVNGGNSTTPTSNATAATTQADELLVGAIGAETDTSESFTVGASYTGLPRSASGTGGTPTNQVAANPEYRIVSATGAYTATGTLGVQRRWAAVIATYRAARCGNSAVEPGEQCDDGNTASGDCCSPTCLFEAAETVCRASAGVCDVVETCTGTSGTCPANQLVAAGTVCRAAAGACDVAETCSGASAACPADVLGAAGTPCRASTGPCDPAETCTGASSACPADQLAAAGTTCRAAAGVCDVAESCTGTSATCPIDGLAVAGTVCRAAAGACDVAEACSGASAACPADQLVAAGTTCRAVAGVCDVAETCTGASAACPADQLVAAGTTCRAASGTCDVAETCTGSSSTCPSDQVLAAGTVCRAPSGTCDVAETCSGTSGACPADQLVGVGTTCRAAAGPCDVAETCTGTSGACPTNGFTAAGTVCRASAGGCDVAEACTGTSAACPTDAFVAAGTVCRASAGACDVADSCTGSSPACPADQHLAAGTTCRAAAGACDVAESCSGSSAACPADQLVAAGTTCRAAAGVCDLAETCSGTSAACPVDAKSTAVCRPTVGGCDVAEACDGAANACPTDGFSPASTVCRAPAGPCDVAEVCDGGLPSCPADLMQPSTVECRPAVGPCDAAETCTGTGAACPPDAMSTAVCRPSVGACDPAERCDGTSLDCPADRLVPAGTVCRAAADACDRVEACTGTSAACPPDIVQLDGVPCSDGDRCTFGDVCHGGVCIGTTPDGPCPDALFCYKAKPASQFSPFPHYHLVDDFEDRYFDVTKPRGLCQAAATDGEPVTGPTRRLAGYAMRSGSGTLARQTDVRIVNDIGAITLNTGKPDVVRVPASVPNAPPDPNGGIDHHKCYKVFIAAGTPKLQRGIRVQVGDGFTSPPKMLELLKPAHLCMPADADSQGVQEPNIVLLCYATRPAKGEPRHAPQTGVQLDDEFGSLVLNTVKELELCLPSVRVVP